jgi:hypothetical protein
LKGEERTMSEPVGFTDETIVVVAEEVLSNKLSDEEAILNLKSGVYYGLDPVGARVWELVQAPVSVGRLLETLLGEYDVERDPLRRDLVELLGKLASENLIEVRKGRGA